MSVVLGVAVTRGVHQPAEEHREQDEGDQSTDQRPVHGAKPYTSGATDAAVRRYGADHLDVKRNLFAR